MTASTIGAKSIRYEFGVRNFTTVMDAAKGYVVAVSAVISEAQAIAMPEELSSGLKKYFGP